MACNLCPVTLALGVTQADGHRLQWKAMIPGNRRDRAHGGLSRERRLDVD